MNTPKSFKPYQLRSGTCSSDPRSAMADYYQSRAKNDAICQDCDLNIQEEKLKLEQAKFARDEQKDQFDRKRLKTHENKSLIEAFSEISKLNFETMKMRQKMKEETKMSDEEIANIFPLLKYPPKPSWS